MTDRHVKLTGDALLQQAAHWLDTPEASAVIIVAQDMLLSRTLMRGCASSWAT